MNTQYLLAFLFFILNTSISIAQKIEEVVVYSAYYDGILVESLVKDTAVSELLITSKKGEKIYYVISHLDSMILLTNYDKNKMEENKSREIWFDTSFRFIKEKIKYSGTEYLTEVQYINKEKHTISYNKRFDDNQNPVNSDTTTHVDRLFDYRGYPYHQISTYFKEGKKVVKNIYYLHKFDKQDRLLESKTYKEEDLKSVHQYEYFDDQQMVKVTHDGPIFNSKFNLYFDGQQLVRLEKISGDEVEFTREFKYDDQKRLMELKELNDDGKVRMLDKYEYKLRN